MLDCMSGTPCCEVCGNVFGGNVSPQGLFVCDTHMAELQNRDPEELVEPRFDWKTGVRLTPSSP